MVSAQISRRLETKSGLHFFINWFDDGSFDTTLLQHGETLFRHLLNPMLSNLAAFQGEKDFDFIPWR